MLNRPVVLSDPTDVIAVVPHLLGFGPRDALVILAERNRRVYLAAWMVVPAPGREDTARELVQPVLARGVPDSVCLLGWERTRGTAVRAVLTVAHHPMAVRFLVDTAAGVQVIEVCGERAHR